MTSSRRIPGELGIWLFVAGDLIVFGVFFVLIALGQRQSADSFVPSRAQLDLRIGVVNTLLLLTASWFVATAIERHRQGERGACARHLTLGMLCGAGFVANKAVEWSGKLQHGITPATNEFFMFFFVFTGIHLLHVLVGIAVLGVLRGVSRKPAAGPHDLRTLESGATFWHLVDLLWIVLFALLYLL
jgi:nitric oxide reductase NorE protein